MTDWTRQVRAQTRLIIDQIASTRMRLSEMGIESEGSLESYYQMLERLFDSDMQLAKLRDNSDLLLRAEGDAFDQDPRIQIVSSVFSNVTDQVTDLTKAILGTRSDGKVTNKAVDLGLSGIARGSLYFGLKAHTPDKSLPLLGENDSLFDSTKRALRIIDDVAHSVEYDDEHVSIEQLSEVVTDPRIRDAALLAVQRIAPSGRRGIDMISVSGAQNAPAKLTSNHRKAIRMSLDKPVIRGEEIEFQGDVREIDLDAHRFDLRGIADEQVRDVRCAYRSVEGLNPRDLLGAKIRARGLVERASDGIPRLMSVLSLEIIREAPEHLG